MSQHIRRFERSLETLFETTFRGLAAPGVDVRRVLREITRAMQQHDTATSTAGRPIIRGRFTVACSSAEYERYSGFIVAHQGELASAVTEIARDLGYELGQSPEVTVESQSLLPPGTLRAFIDSTHASIADTSAFRAMPVSASLDRHAYQAELILPDSASFPLSVGTIHIGRHADNDIIIDDPKVSRFHLQVRLRQQEHVVFDTGSRSGTRVNGHAITEHTLQPGDVIEIGSSHLVYIRQEAPDRPTPTTQSLDPV